MLVARPRACYVRCVLGCAVRQLCVSRDLVLTAMPHFAGLLAASSHTYFESKLQAAR